MKIIKPLRLMVMPRPYRWRNGKYLAVTLAALIQKQGDDISILPEHTLVSEVLPELDADEVLDFVMPKPHPEFLVSGFAFTAHQDDKTRCMVSVRVGDKEKEALVFGNRYWIDNRISSPQPFESLPLTWGNSFGGAGHPDNPVGTGLDEVDIDGIPTIRLPNLESTIERIHARGQIVKPTNFGQVRIDWPHRLSKLGTCTEHWVQQVGTGFFDDMDPSAFNAAADDQIWKDRDAFAMNEEFEIWNMHPSQQCWSGTLPALQARCFIRRCDSEGKLDEMSMRPTTVWFVPHRCSYILLFHGNIPIQEDDGFDIKTIMAALEWAAEPKTADHYASIFDIRSDVEQAAMHALQDEELMPAGILAPWLESTSLDDHPMLSKLGDKLNRFSNAYASGELAGPLKPLTLSDLPELAMQGNSLHEAMIQKNKEEFNSAMEASRRTVARSAPDSKEAKLARQLEKSLDIGGDEQDLRLPFSGPPDLTSLLSTVKAQAYRKHMRQTFREVDQGTSSTREMYDFGKRSLRQMYLYSVHFQEGVPKADAHRVIQLRERVLQKYHLNKRLSGMDLTGADLSHMDLPGADFSGSWLERVDFSNTNLEGAKFDETVLARGSFVNTKLDYAVFKETNISETEFIGASLKGARFEEIIAEKRATFESCNFEDGVFKSFSSDDMEFHQCSFAGTRAMNIVFNACKFVACQFVDARLDKITFQNSLLDDAVFSKTTLVNSSFFGATLKQTRLSQCVWIQTTISKDVSIHELSLQKCLLRRCLFSEVEFEKTDFESSTFEQCNFTLATFKQCSLRKIATPQSNFIRADFERADLSGSNLMQGNFAKASFLGANLSGCNLFRSDMSETMLNASTLTHGANVHRTRMAPFRDDAARSRDISS